MEKFKAGVEEAHVFVQKDRAAKTICETKMIIFAMHYCGKDSNSLTDLRCLWLRWKWKSALDPKNWGCGFDNASLVPLMTDEEPARGDVLKIR